MKTKLLLFFRCENSMVIAVDQSLENEKIEALV